MTGGAIKPVRSELWLRVVSALVLIAIALPLIWLGGNAFYLMCVLLGLVLAYEWWTIIARRSLPVGQKLIWLGLGVIYALLPVLTLPMIRGADAPLGIFLILLLFVVVAASDVGAYFSGRHFGGPKLAPRISPKKTRSGAIGGMVLAGVAGFLMSVIFGQLSPLGVALGALGLSVCAQAGDLFESWIKRQFDVKDSSNLIPGHGGFMDRLDGLVIAAIPMAVYVLLTLNNTG